MQIKSYRSKFGFKNSIQFYLLLSFKQINLIELSQFIIFLDLVLVIVCEERRTEIILSLNFRTGKIIL